MNETSEPEDALLRHLETLYTLAQAVTLDTSAAAQLIEATYHRAYTIPPEDRPAVDEKAWLYRLMLQIRDEQRRADRPVSGHDLEPQPPPDQASAGQDVRQRLVERLLDRKLPVALATLPEDLRLLVTLCEVEHLSCADAGRVLHLEAETACARLKQALTALQHTLWSNMTDVERRLLDTRLLEELLRPALRRVIQSEFAPLPPTLQQTVAAASRAADMEHRAPAAPAPGPRADSVPRPVQRRLSRSLHRLLVPFVLILAAGVTGYLISELLEQEPDANLITLSARNAGGMRPIMRTGSAEQAERFIRSRLDWRLIVPEIEGAILTGVGISEVAPGAEVPIFFYDDTRSDQPITLYAYSYAFLSRHADRVRLGNDILNQIQDDQHFDLHDLGEDKVLIWRHRDEIFVAVTRGDAESLAERIYFPS